MLFEIYKYVNVFYQIHLYIINSVAYMRESDMDKYQLFMIFYLLGISLVISVGLLILKPKYIKYSPIISIVISNILLFMESSFLLSDILSNNYDHTTIFALYLLIPGQALFSVVIAVIVWTIYYIKNKIKHE